MAIKFNREERNTSFFITFTCVKWIELIAESNSHQAFYKWFRYLQTIDVKVLSYVIMPNHFHAIFHISANCPKTINQIVSNGKRFLAYDIVKNLEKQNKEKLLSYLFENTPENEKRKGTKHKIFQTSFDCKELFNMEMLETKVDYIHRNPCLGKWNLASDFTLYTYSSAAHYEGLLEDEYVTHYREI